MSGHPCEVCGWPDDDLAPDVSGAPTYAICDCCGAESGVDDATPRSVQVYRRSWLRRSTPWSDPRRRPDGWDASSQLASIGLGTDEAPTPS